MRQARSYGIVDHQLLHGKYLHRLSHKALALYLFLVVVSDREGKNFYADKTVAQILRLSDDQLKDARSSLIRLKLLDYRSPYWWLMSLTKPGPCGFSNPAPAPALPPSDHASSPSSGLSHIRDLLQTLQAVAAPVGGSPP